MAEDYAADVDELKQLLARARRPRVQGFLQVQIESLEKEGENAARAAKAVDEEPIDMEVILPSTDDKAAVQESRVLDKGLTIQPLLKITKTIEPYYVTLSRFGWDQETDRINVYISLDGAVKERITSDIKTESFELKILDVNGKNYRCGVARLHKAVVPSSAVVTVRPRRIVLTLKKAIASTWSDIQYKEEKFKGPPSQNDKDPMAGIMDLMKNMYEEGDEETKRTIAKAWSESRSGKMPTPSM